MHRAAPDPPPPAARRPRRWRVGLGLLLAVLLLHASLLDRLAPGPSPAAGLPRPASVQTAMQVRSLVAPPRRTDPVPADARPAQPATAQPATAQPATARAAAGPPAAPAAEPAARTSAGTSAGASAGPAAAAKSPAAPDRMPAGTAPAGGALPATAAAADPSTASTATATATATATTAAAAAAARADAATPEAGLPPPVYATTVPAPVLLRYRLQSGGQVGEATLDWRHDGQRYALLLDARGSRAQPLIEQASQGGFDAAGLAPLRFTDRRRGRGQRAANFRRDIGRISFSGPQLDYPAWPGAQDRLSGLAQLAAIQGAAPVPLPSITLFVVDAQGGDWWRWTALGAESLTTPLGPVAAQRWQREPDRPDRPDGQRIEVWLDAARGHWPVQLRFTALRSGDVLELQLAAEPALPPPLPPVQSP